MLYLEEGEEEIQFLLSSATIKANTTCIKDVADKTDSEEIVWHI